MRPVILIALSLVMATPAVAEVDVETCIPVLEAAEIRSDTTRMAQGAYDRAEARARRIRNDAKGNAAIVMDNLRLDTMAAGREWYGSKVEAKAQVEYDLAVARADRAYGEVMEAPHARLVRAKNLANREFMTTLREAWDGPTSDSPAITTAILIQFLRNCASLLGVNLD